MRETLEILKENSPISVTDVNIADITYKGKFNGYKIKLTKQTDWSII